MGFLERIDKEINAMEQKNKLLEELSQEQHESLGSINRLAAGVYFRLKDREDLSGTEKEYLEFAWTVIDMTENPYGETGILIEKLTREFGMTFKKEENPIK